MGHLQLLMLFSILTCLELQFLLYLNWHYADHKNFIHEKISGEEIRFTKIVNLSFILVAITAIGLSVCNSTILSNSLYYHVTNRDNRKIHYGSVKKGTNNNF